MHTILTTAALAALLWGAQPALAQEQGDLERLIEDGIDAPAVRAVPSDVERGLLSDAEIDDLVAPIALFPDSLLAQVLVASTFPLQIVQSDRLLQDSAEMTDGDLTAAIDREWDPSVLVLLTGFPDVVRRMAENLDDTERLGIAMAEQDQDVLDSVQRLREQAEATGWLADSEAQIVERVDDRIVIEPSDPDVIYVPRYDERRAFTSAPTQSPVILQPGATPQSFNPMLAGAIGFGSALLVNEMFGDDDSDSDKDGWDDYWRKDRRAIHWRDRQLYPRAQYYDDVNLRREAAWSRERDEQWDRQAKRWRAERAEQRRELRQDRDWVVRRDRNTGKAQVKLRDWSDVRATIERQDRRLDRTQDALEAERKRNATLLKKERREDVAQERAARERAVQLDAAQRENKRDGRQSAETKREGAQKRAAARENAKDERERQARREANREQERKAAAREGNEKDMAARTNAQASETRDGDAARKANQTTKSDRERQAKRVKAAAKDKPGKQAAEENRKTARKAADQQAEPKPKAQAQPSKPRAEAKRAPAQQADKPKKKAQAKDQPKKKKKNCNKAKGEDCRPKN